MVEPKSLFLENKTNRNRCKTCLSQSWVVVAKSQILNNSFSISQPVLDLAFVTPDKNMSRENLITYKKCMIPLIC